MNIELTEQQEADLEDSVGSPHRVISRRTKEVFFLVPEAEYESVRELLEEERQQRIIHEIGMRNAACRADEEL